MGRIQRKVEEQFKKFEGALSRVKIRSQVANIANDKVGEGVAASPEEKEVWKWKEWFKSPAIW